MSEEISTKASELPENRHPLCNIVERLLYEDESNVLDFKAEQYAFGAGTDEQRGELLKDILAMVNSWGRADMRYILIGIREVAGNRPEVVGIQQHLPEHALQQLVNGRTNRPLEFSYHAVDINGKSVGVIAVPAQPRPVYLKKAYGRLAPHTVYIRRGSSTAVAEPDEIAQMGIANLEQNTRVADLVVELASPEKRTVYSDVISVSVTPIRVPADDQLPDYGQNGPYYLAGFRNTNYYREVARYVSMHMSTLALGFHVRNVGTGVASNVILRIEIPSGTGFSVAAKPVESPSEYITINNAIVEHAQEQARPLRPKVRPARTTELQYDIGVAQPGLAIWTDPFYLVVDTPGTLRLSVDVYADQLATPKQVEFTIDALGEVKEVTPEFIIRFGHDLLA